MSLHFDLPASADYERQYAADGLHVLAAPLWTSEGGFARCSCGTLTEVFQGMSAVCAMAELLDNHAAEVKDLRERYTRDVDRLRRRELVCLARLARS